MSDLALHRLRSLFHGILDVFFGLAQGLLTLALDLLPRTFSARSLSLPVILPTPCLIFPMASLPMPDALSLALPMRASVLGDG